MRPPDAEALALLNFQWRSGRFGGSCGAGLSLTVPDDHVTPASVTEVVAVSYQRVALPTDATGFAASLDRAIETIVSTTWPAPLEDWGVCLSIVLWDTLTKATGTPVGAVELGAGVNILAGGNTLSAPAGVIRFIAN